jgi:hypothetical protein
MRYSTYLLFDIKLFSIWYELFGGNGVPYTCFKEISEKLYLKYKR